MKYFFFLIILAVSALPSVGYASTVSISPSSVTVSPGQSVTLTLVVDPQGVAYTAKVALSFSPDLLSVTSFSHASGWMPLSQSGYDSIDNSSGSLVKTGGVTGGFSSPKVFGTVTFTAKATGTAYISVTGATQILDSSNQNTFTGGGQATISIALPAPQPIVAPTPAPASTAKPKASPVRHLMETKVSEEKASTTTVAEAATATTDEVALTAQTASATTPIPILSFAIPVLTFLVGFILGQRGRV